jgi:hypothetical protein
MSISPSREAAAPRGQCEAVLPLSNSSARGVGDMREGQTRTGRSRELLDRATGAIEMQRVHENANSRPACRVYDTDRWIKV